MASKEKATAASGSGVGAVRRTWDHEEYAARARERDRKERELMEQNEERKRKGLKPLKRWKEEMPKPTEELKQREAPLGLDKNLGKTIMVENPTKGGQKQPGFYCELCRRTYKDTMAYLDHINGRSHLARLGQTTQVGRSTVEQVRARIEKLRAEREDKTRGAANYDFEARLRAIAEEQEKAKLAKREQKKAEKEKAEKAKLDQLNEGGLDQDAMALMGFASFGAGKKR
ncbi:U4/U6.U5 snRNP associated protein [Tilletia horrida]|uniref:U4/U6.U5 snRNP associated protein n=1 Tax=Tilletia horrida TaxID=155126 RepID=A0AAN6GEW9_9BASI|nr:U4/U6.U5 snRNP associated protein [Tilletia horrida]